MFVSVSNLAIVNFLTRLGKSIKPVYDNKIQSIFSFVLNFEKKLEN